MVNPVPIDRMRFTSRKAFLARVNPNRNPPNQKLEKGLEPVTDHTDDTVLNRRKALARIGTFALAAYTVPALTTLSAAHASSSSSSSSTPSTPSASSGPSGSDDSKGTDDSGSWGGDSKGACEAIDVGGTWDETTGTCMLPK